MTHPQAHITKRKISKLKPYPSNDRRVRILDKVIYVVGVLGPIMTIPQVWQIWMLGKYDGVSITTWSAYLLFSLAWTLYGYVHKELAIVVSSALSLAVQLLVVMGILFL